MGYEIALIGIADCLYVFCAILLSAFAPQFPILRFLAYLPPIALCFAARKKRERAFAASGSVDPAVKLSAKLPKKALPRLLPLLLPVIAVIVAASAVFSLIFDTGAGVNNDSLLAALVIRAILPAIFEELLFRFFPLTLIGEYPRVAVFVSAGLFAAVHADPAQILYAFIAGMLFALVDLFFASILPSVILHLLNNLLSLVWMTYGKDAFFRFGILPALCVLLLLSVALLILRRRDYRGIFTPLKTARLYADDGTIL